MSSLLGSQSDDDGSRVGEGDLPNHGRSPKQRWTLEVKEEENPAKEAFNATAFAQFLFGPGGRQTGAITLRVWDSKESRRLRPRLYESRQ